MALTIVNEQYPPRKPKLTLTADSLDELPTEGVAEGSTATVGGTEYSYDSNAGWIVPGEGGGGGQQTIVDIPLTYDQTEYHYYVDDAYPVANIARDFEAGKTFRFVYNVAVDNGYGFKSVFPQSVVTVENVAGEGRNVSIYFVVYNNTDSLDVYEYAFRYDPENLSDASVKYCNKGSVGLTG